MAIYHTITDAKLLSRVRSELQGVREDGCLTLCDLQQILKLPLLSSVYAETLRLYDKAFIFVASPSMDTPLGDWKFPKGAMGMLNSDICHMDNTFWNTKDGLHPVDKFWAERFLWDPSDALSGPLDAKVRRKLGIEEDEQGSKDGTPIFSTKGCEGVWVPYGGRCHPTNSPIH
jgi:hypothetical protein